MALENFQKQPCERYFVGVDFVKALGSGEEIVLASSTIKAVDVNGADATSVVFESNSAAVSGTQLLIRVLDGDPSRSAYKLTFCARTNQGNAFEKDIKMKVKEL